MKNGWRRRYLELLGVESHAPSLDHLTDLVRAQRSIVFENVSSLLRRRAAPVGPVPTLDHDVILTSWENRSAGGVCYEVSSMLGRLLRELGYDAHPVLARISWPDGHQAVEVRLNDTQYIVDSGCGQPLFEPIPVETPFTVTCAGLSYRFRLDSMARELVQDRWINAAWAPFVYYDLAPRPADDYEAAYQRHHVLPGESFVMSNLRLVSCNEDEVIQLMDHQFTRYRTDGKTAEEVYGVARYKELIADAFGLPGMDVGAGLTAWSNITGAKI